MSKDRHIMIRVSNDDYRVLAEKAKAAGITMSEFVRRMIKEYAFPEKPDAEFMKLFLKLSHD